MSNLVEVTLPDIGDFESVEIIEVLVAAGDEIEVEDPLITLESDKASMSIPSPYAGKIKEIQVAVTGGYLRIESLQLSGKRKMDAVSFLNGFQFEGGDRFI